MEVLAEVTHGGAYQSHSGAVLALAEPQGRKGKERTALSSCTACEFIEPDPFTRYHPTNSIRPYRKEVTAS